MLTLELLGALDRYSSVFRTPRDQKWREKYLVSALTQDPPMAVVKLYAERVGIPPNLRVRARARRISGFVTRFAERATQYAKRRAAGMLQR
jgi:hypothetical protein